MAEFSGEYVLIKSENFGKQLVALGAPEEWGKGADDRRPTYKINVDGKKITIDSKEESGPAFHFEFVLDEEVEEKHPHISLKSTATMSGDTFTVTSVDQLNRKSQRTHKFEGSIVTVTYKYEDASIPVATRTFKKL